mmetsp:Transcript_97812/g.119818  ORF Transcript_97812/g.119818 Transcript_97812/m.119818 type:complete len:423 (+) Transcript_97812:1154-2422(+)
MHASLGNGHALLFHRFVDRHAIHLVHLVELVDANGAPIRQDHGTRLQMKLAGAGVPNHGCGQTNATGAAARGADGQGSCVHHEAQHLRFATGRIAHEKYIDISSKVSSVGQVLFDTAEHLQQKTGFHSLMTANGWRKGTCQEFEGVLSLGNLVDVFDVFGGELGHRQGADGLDVGRHQLGRKDAIGEVLQWWWEGPIDSDHLDAISRLRLVTEVAIANHLDAPWNLPGRRCVGRLLDGEMLRVLVHAKGDIHLHFVAFLILLGKACRAHGGLDQAGGVSVIALLHMAIVLVLAHVYGIQKLGLCDQAAGDQTFNTHQLARALRRHATRSDMVSPKGSLQIQSQVLLEVRHVLGGSVNEKAQETFFISRQILHGILQDLLLQARLCLLQRLQLQGQAKDSISQCRIDLALPLLPVVEEKVLEP